MTTLTFSPTHPLGPNGPDVSALGVGTWALGGPWTFNGRDAGWGEVDDDVSVAALHAVIDHGVRFIDTASAYGTGHSERVIGRALAELPASVRDEIVVATKFGLVVDEESRSGGGEDVSPAAIRRQCADSRRRLGRDRLDVLQLHGGADGAAGAEDVVATLEELVSEGTIRWFGTAQDSPEVIEVFARSPHCLTVQTQANVFGWSSQVLELARARDSRCWPDHRWPWVCSVAATPRIGGPHPVMSGSTPRGGTTSTTTPWPTGWAGWRRSGSC